MAKSDGPSAPAQGVQPLPLRANLEHLRNQAKQHLVELRQTHSGANLAEAQHAIAKRYGFKSWRVMKAAVDGQLRQRDALLAAVRAGDVVTLRALLDTNRSWVNAAVEDRETRTLPTDTRAMRLLHVAVAENRPEIARLLLERGADPNVRNADGRTPLHDCWELNPHRAEIRDLLMQHGAELDAALAAVIPNLDRLRELLERDPSLANDRTTNLSPLAWATVGWSPEAIRLLLEHGADFGSEPGRRDVMWALAATASSEALRLLLEAGLDPDSRFPDGDTLLHRAIRGDNEDLVAFAAMLLDRGLDPSATNQAGRSLLDEALAADGAPVEEHATGQAVGVKRHGHLIALLRSRGGREGRKEQPLSADILKALGDAIYRDRGDIEAVTKLLDEHPQLANSRPWAPRYPQTAIEAVAGMCVWHRPKMHAIAKLLVERGAEADVPTLARCGLVDEVRRRIEAEPSLIDRPDDKGRTPLYRAVCVYGDFTEGEAVADLLLERGATVDIWTACTLAMIDRVRELLAGDPSLANAVDGDGMCPLHWAARVRRNAGNAPAIARLLCEAGADVEAVNRQEDGMHPLHHCGEWMSAPEVVDVLLAFGADINAAAEQNGWTPLDYAVDRRREPMIAYFEGKGGQRSRVEDRMVRAVLRGDTPRLKRLLDQHPEKMTTATGGPWDKPLLHLAAWEGHAEIVDELLKRGFDPDTRCRTDNAYPLHFAAEKGRLDIVRRLVDAGGDIHGDGDDHQMGVLGWATCLHAYHQDVADFLLERGARLHIFSAVAMNWAGDVRRMSQADPTLLEAKMSRNEHHRRPLHLAVLRNRPEMVRLLLELGADLHATDDTGATPLTCASEQADPAMLAILQSAGAQMDIISALRMKRYDVAEALLREEPSRIGPHGRDTIALHLSTHRGDADAVRWLIAHGVDVNAKRTLWDCNHTALHVCAEHDLPEMAEILLDAGADPSIPDDKYHSPPLGWAHHCNRPRMIRLLETRGGR